MRLAVPPVKGKADPVPAPAVPQVGPPPGVAPAAGTGQITGTVTAAAGGALLQSVFVYAYTSKTAATYDYVAIDFTGADGKYALTGLADGSYYLRFEKTDYLTSYYNGRASLAEADAVSVTLGGVTGNINAALVLGGKITGTITAAVGGALLEDVTVYAYTSKTAGTYDYVAYDYTGADGKYALTGLATGTYYLRFAKTDYFTSYYNAKASLAEADGVSVTLGVETGNINAALVLGGKITGTVTAAAGGALLQDVTVYAYTSKTAGTYDYVAYDYTGADGVYSLSGLTAGTYYLRFAKTDYFTSYYNAKANTGADGVYSLGGLTAGTYYLRFEKTDYLISYYNAKASLAEADGVSVALGGVTGSINAALVLGGKITGTVTAAAGGALLQDVTVYAYTSKTVDTYDYVAYDYTGADGVYTLSGLTAGNYYLRFAKTDYLTSYYNGRASLADADAVSVALGGVTGNINAALAEGGKISGHVTAEGTGAPLEDVQVSIYTTILICGMPAFYLCRLGHYGCRRRLHRHRVGDGKLPGPFQAAQQWQLGRLPG